MSEKPQKRLVSKSRYAWLMTQRTMLTIGVVLLSPILGLSIFGCVIIVLQHFTGFQDKQWVMWTLCYTGIAAVACFLALRLIKTEAKIERASLLTNRTSHLLPPEDSLVRASDLPPFQQQDELLRAAPYGKETPAEQLLRAGEENRQDV